MTNARERARLRIAAWFDADGAPTQAEAGKRIGWKQPRVSKMLTNGPLLKDLDVISRLIGISSEALVAPTEPQPMVVRERPDVPYGRPGTAAAGVTSDASEPLPAAEVLAQLRQILEALRPLLDTPGTLAKAATFAHDFSQMNASGQDAALRLIHDATTWSRGVDARYIPGAKRKRA